MPRRSPSGRGIIELLSPWCPPVSPRGVLCLTRELHEVRLSLPFRSPPPPPPSAAASLPPSRSSRLLSLQRAPPTRQSFPPRLSSPLPLSPLTSRRVPLVVQRAPYDRLHGRSSPQLGSASRSTRPFCSSICAPASPPSFLPPLQPSTPILLTMLQLHQLSVLYRSWAQSCATLPVRYVFISPSEDLRSRRQIALSDFQMSKTRQVSLPSNSRAIRLLAAPPCPGSHLQLRTQRPGS